MCALGKESPPAQARGRYAAQNSSVLLIGPGAAKSMDSGHVNWPSGRTSEIGGPIAAEREFTVRDGPE